MRSINIDALADMTVARHRPRPHVEGFELAVGRRLGLVAGGRLDNLAAAQGHPAAVMDMSFANQALVLEWLAREGGSLAPGVHPVPETIDSEVARLKLAALGVEIDTLTPQQQHYLTSWQEGT